MDFGPIYTEVNLTHQISFSFKHCKKRGMLSKKKRGNAIVHSEYEAPILIVNGMSIDEKAKEIKRAGCIFYTIDSKTNEPYFCFGRDTKTKDLTDFGGGRKADESPAQCAAREANEETLGIFGKITESDILVYSAFYNRDMYIAFIYVDSISSENIQRESVKRFSELYQESLSRSGKPEICSIHWLSQTELEKRLGLIPYSGYNIYTKVRRFLYSGFHLHDQKNNYFTYMRSLQEKKENLERRQILT